MARKKAAQTVDDNGEAREIASGHVLMHTTNDHTSATIDETEYTVDDNGEVEVAKSHVAAMQAHGFALGAAE